MEKEIIMSSSASTRKSLEAIRNGSAGLSERRKALLQKVPHSGDYAKFEKDSITTKDIAYLSAATDHEFALLRGKHVDIIFHGVKGHCRIEGELFDLLVAHKLQFVAHTHPDYDSVIPSPDDRKSLELIRQKESIIISYITGVELKYTAGFFEEDEIC